MPSRRRSSSAFKAQIVQQVLREDKTLAQIAAEHGVHPNQISQWKATGYPQSSSAATALRRRKKPPARSKQKNSTNRSAGSPRSLPGSKKNLALTLSRSERLAFLERGLQAVPLTAQADLLTVSRASLYYQPAVPSAEEVALKRRIDEIFTARPFYGSRRICQQLRRESQKNEGHVINRKSVQRQMQQMGLIALGPKPNTSCPNRDHTVYPYLLRNLSSGWPDHIWGIDITYIRLPHGWLYLVAVLDWFSRYVLAWELDQTLEMPFVLAPDA